MEEEDRRAIVRLAVAVLAADATLDPAELRAVERLDGLGFGALSVFAREEIERAMLEPVDLDAACARLRPALGDSGPRVVGALVELAASDRIVSTGELRVLRAICAGLGLPAAVVAARVLGPMLGALLEGEDAAGAASAAGDPLGTLGVPRGAGVAEMAAAYGAAVRRLASVTEAFEAALHRGAPGARASS